MFLPGVCTGRWRTSEKSATNREYRNSTELLLPVFRLEGNRNLENKNLLFLYSENHHAATLETCFLPRHFMHLTGVDAPSYIHKSVAFYEACLGNRLSPDSFEIKLDGTTEMKLQVLPQLMKIQHTARMLGNYNSSKTYLHTEKLVGGQAACLGFVKEVDFYSPNTAIREDLRHLVYPAAFRVYATFAKYSEESVYTHLCYLAKKLTLADKILKEAAERHNIDLSTINVDFVPR